MLEECDPLIVEEFGYLNNDDNSKLHYLDSGASSLRPQSVISAMEKFEKSTYANVHRGVYRRSEESTLCYERVRKETADFLGARSENEIVFTSGATAGLNIVAQCYGRSVLSAGDEICLAISEHHSNIVPWQMVAEQVGCRLVYIPLDSRRRLDMDAARSLIHAKTKIVAVAHVSNVTGVVNPIAELVEIAKEFDAVTVVDGSQAGGHLEVDVSELGCDFYVLTGHKMLAPSGVGVLYGRECLLNQTPPLFGGGEMISSVGLQRSQYKQAPHRFEAGTPLITAVVGLGRCLELWGKIDRIKAQEKERELGEAVVEYLESIPGVKLLCPVDRSADWIGTVAFEHESIHPHDLAAIMDSFGVCIRAGQHCTEPLHQALGIHSSIRVSPFVYNSMADIRVFIEAMEKCRKLFDV